MHSLLLVGLAACNDVRVAGGINTGDQSHVPSNRHAVLGVLDLLHALLGEVDALVEEEQVQFVERKRKQAK